MLPLKHNMLRLLLILLALAAVAAVAAQETTLRLSLRRDLGYGLGPQIQGRFSLRVDAPEEVVRVVFLLDGAVMAEDGTRPFRHNFSTGDYALGLHTFSAVGYAADGREIPSNPITRQIVGGQQTLFFLGALLAVVVIAWLGSVWLSRRRGGRGYGPLGATVCPHCGRPYGLHLWAPNLMAGRLDRCPHCGKWRLVRRATPEALAAAEARAPGLDGDKEPAPPAPNAEDVLRRRLDDSRFEDN